MGFFVLQIELCTKSECAPLAQALFDGESGNSVVEVSARVVPVVNGR